MAIPPRHWASGFVWPWKNWSVFVKFGQTLSTRRDLLPDAVALELIRLQDRVPPFPGQEARSLVEQTLGASVDTLFVCFDETPLASASVAQVHLARLPDGEEVVVKVLRPGIEQRIREDVALLYGLADWIQRYWPGLATSSAGGGGRIRENHSG